MKLPTPEEIREAGKVVDVDGPESETFIQMQRMILRDPTLTLRVDQLLHLFFEMPRPTEALARTVVVAALRRGMLYGLAIAEARLTRTVLGPGTGGAQ